MRREPDQPQRDEDDPEYLTCGRRLAEQGERDDGRKQGDKAPRERVGLSEITQNVGAGEGKLVSHVQEYRADDHGPCSKRRNGKEWQRAAGDHRSDKSHPCEHKDLVRTIFDQ
jgi:hypothetical protein